MPEKNSLDANAIKFYDNYLPALPGGDYTISVSQEIVLKDGSKKEFKTERLFRVAAPQFNLEPSEIYACYPPDKSRGDFSNSLPQIVFKQRILPWARPLDNDPGKRSLPWLALLLFTETELSGGDTETGAINGTIGGFLNPAAGMLIPPVIPESGIDLNEPCHYIEITREIFSSLIPSLDELKYLAHCRSVNTADKPILNMKHQGDFGIVIGNRLPRTRPGVETRYIAHLVSLEGFAPYLKDQKQLAKYDKIRLLSLARWSFTVIASEHGDLREALENLTQSSGGQLLLRLTSKNLETGSAAATIQSRLENGYLPLPYHLSSGEDTFAWYRGPLTPQPVKSWVGLKPFFSTTAAMIYDHQNGLFDLSLAVARQIGQSLALADNNFCFALRQLNQKGHQAIDTVFARTQSRIFADQKETNLAAIGRYGAESKFTAMLDQNLAVKIQNIHRDLPPPIQDTPQRENNGTFTHNKQASDYRKSLSSFYDQADLPAYLEQFLHEELEVVATWLCELYLLYKVPFNHLIPHRDLLPKESIRFFYVDQNWLAALIDGALSVGLQSSRDERLYLVIQDKLIAKVQLHASNLRKKLQGRSTNFNERTSPESYAQMSGMFIRSKLIANWPGLEIIAFDEDHNQLEVRRMDHLTPEILLVMYAGVPRQIVFKEPAEGTCLRINECITLRRITGAETGQKVGEYHPREIFKEAGVIDISKLVTELRQALNISEDEFGPAAFALQLLQLPRRFIMNSAKGKVTEDE